MISAESGYTPGQQFQFCSRDFQIAYIAPREASCAITKSRLQLAFFPTTGIADAWHRSEVEYRPGNRTRPRRQGDGGKRGGRGQPVHPVAPGTLGRSRRVLRYQWLQAAVLSRGGVVAQLFDAPDRHWVGGQRLAQVGQWVVVLGLDGL
jgi:hypothetical protein